MKKITLAKPAKETTSSVVLYVYTREGGAGCGCSPGGVNCIPVGDVGCGQDNGICGFFC